MTPHIVTENIAKLLQKLSLPQPITVDDIKDIIWNEQKPNGSLELFMLLTKQEKDPAIIAETMHLIQDAWNYFPHRVLGGKSPHDLVMEYQQTGTVDKNKQKTLPKRGKSLHEVFAGQHPGTVTFEKQSDDTWGFGYPTVHHELTERLCELEETPVPTAVFEQELHSMLKRMPELFDAVNDLAHLYGKKKQPGIAKTLYEQAIANAKHYIPKTFVRGRDRAIWAYMPNRPFLRMLAGYAIFVEQNAGIEYAIPFYEEILSFNPNDNQGIRAILATAYLKTGQPEKVIELASHYGDDMMIDLVMGTLLAYVMLKEHKKATAFLERIKKRQSHVIKELLKPSHVKPVTATGMEGYISIGGRDEAYAYWQSQGSLWQTTHNAMHFLVEHTKDIQAQIISLTEEDVLAVDVFYDFLAFLTQLKERPLKRTATGNISLKGIEELLKTLKTVQPILQNAKDKGWKIIREDELLPLHLIKIIADIIGLTYKKHDTLRLSKNGKAFLETLSPVEQFSQLFQQYRKRLNWAYYASFTEKQKAIAGLLQRHQDAIWRLLGKKGTAWIDYQTCCRELRDALGLQPYLEESYSTPDEILYRRIDHILFSRILTFFGCVELETKEIHTWDIRIIRFRFTKIGLAFLQDFT